jgi:hypothetical protein
MTLLRWILLALAFVFATPGMAKGGVTVTVSRATGGDWLVDYAFQLRSAVWFFPRSAFDLDGKPWRAQGWTVETPGVTLARAGHYDALSGAAPLTRVRIRMKPFAKPLMGDYIPALAFSDGGLAFYTDHFIVTPAKSIAAARALPGDLNGVRMPQPTVTLVVRDPGRRLLLRGKTLTGRVRYRLGGEDAYVYSGPAPVIETASFAGVIDSGLPGWVRTELDNFTPRVMGLYAQRLGAPAGGRPMALIAWQGGTQPGRSLNGSVLDQMLVMQLAGQQVLSPSPFVMAEMRWFIGHESAHFWMGQTVRYSRDDEGWILEGAADLLAVRAMGKLVDDFDSRAFLQDSMKDCLRLQTAGKPLATAGERGENRAYYACGALLMLAAESAAKQQNAGADIFTLMRALIDANRKDGVVTAADWLGEFRSVTGNSALTGAVRGFIEKGVADPRVFWVRLFTATGVGFVAEGEGIRLT